MFYVKKEIGSDMVIKIELNEDTVFGICPLCGAEVQVDLQEILENGGDLYSTMVACEKCSKRKGGVK